MLFARKNNKEIERLKVKIKELDTLLVKHNVYEKDRRLEERKKLKNS